MASHDLSKKISGHEALQWLKNCFQDSNNIISTDGSIDDESQLIDFFLSHKPVGFKNPRKPRTSKVSSDSSERSSNEYSPSLCDARVWLHGGLPGQCSRKKKDGCGCFCAMHHNEANKHDGMTKNGLITGDRPTHHYFDTSLSFIPWHDSEKPVSENTTKKPRCCGICGKPGHNKKRCPDNPDNVNTSPVESPSESPTESPTDQVDSPADQVDSPADQVDSPAESPAESPDESPADSPADQVDSPAESPADPIPEDDDDTASTVSLSPSDAAAAGCGLDIDTSPDDIIQVDTNNSDYIHFEYEGVQYMRKDGKIYDPNDDSDDDDEEESIGTWEDGQVKFNHMGKKAHRFNVALLKE